MKFMLIVHHDEEAFNTIEQEQRERLLAESIALTHQLHAAGQYVHASPLHPAGTAVIVKVREGKTVRDRRPLHRNTRTDCRLLPDRRMESERGRQHRRKSPGGKDGNGRSPAIDRNHRFAGINKMGSLIS